MLKLSVNMMTLIAEAYLSTYSFPCPCLPSAGNSGIALLCGACYRSNSMSNICNTTLVISNSLTRPRLPGTLLIARRALISITL